MAAAHRHTTSPCLRVYGIASHMQPLVDSPASLVLSRHCRGRSSVTFFDILYTVTPQAFGMASRSPVQCIWLQISFASFLFWSCWYRRTTSLIDHQETTISQDISSRSDARIDLDEYSIFGSQSELIWSTSMSVAPILPILPISS